MSLLTETIRWVQTITLEGDRLTADGIVVRRDMVAGVRVDEPGVRRSFVGLVIVGVVNAVLSMLAFVETLQFFDPNYTVFALSLVSLVVVAITAYRLRPRNHLTVMLQDGSALVMTARDESFLFVCLEAFERLWADPRYQGASLYVHAGHQSVDFGLAPSARDIEAGPPVARAALPDEASSETARTEPARARPSVALEVRDGDDGPAVTTRPVSLPVFDANGDPLASDTSSVTSGVSPTDDAAHAVDGVTDAAAGTAPDTPPADRTDQDPGTARRAATGGGFNLAGLIDRIMLRGGSQDKMRDTDQTEAQTASQDEAREPRLDTMPDTPAGMAQDKTSTPPPLPAPMAAPLSVSLPEPGFARSDGLTRGEVSDGGWPGRVEPDGGLPLPDFAADDPPALEADTRQSDAAASPAPVAKVPPSFASDSAYDILASLTTPIAAPSAEVGTDREPDPSPDPDTGRRAPDSASGAGDAATELALSRPALPKTISAETFKEVYPKVMTLVRLLRERTPLDGVNDEVDVLELMVRRGCRQERDVRALQRALSVLRAHMHMYPAAVDLFDDVAAAGGLPITQR